MIAGSHSVSPALERRIVTTVCETGSFEKTAKVCGARLCGANRFKRRGQFWSKGGFASFLEAYVWYTNDELKYLYRQAS